MPLDRNNKITKARSERPAHRKPIGQGAETLELLRELVGSRKHGQQLFAVLLLREVTLLRESEAKMLEEISTLKKLLYAGQAPMDLHRSAAPPNVPDCAACSHDDGSEELVEVLIGEPMASLLGVDGSDNADRSDSITADGQADDNETLKDKPCATGPPPGYKRCFLCATGTKLDHDNCRVCKLLHNTK